MGPLLVAILGRIEDGFFLFVSFMNIQLEKEWQVNREFHPFTVQKQIGSSYPIGEGMAG